MAPSRRVALGALLLACLLCVPRAADAACWIGVDYSVNTLSKSAKMDVASSLNIVLKDSPGGIKIYGPDKDVFKALSGKGVEVIVGLSPPEMIITFAKDATAAGKWLDANIVPYVKTVNIVDIAVANEKMQTDTGNIVDSIVPGMWNLYYALKARGLDGKIKVTTPQHPGFLSTPYPPSKATTVASFGAKWKKLLDFLDKTGSSLSITAYPFFGYQSDPSNYDFFVFKGTKGYYDGKHYYQNGLVQIIDGVLSAAAKQGYGNLPIMIAETGWPTAGDKLASNARAEDYYNGLTNWICSGRGTPLRPNTLIKTYLFEVFDEDWKATKSAPYEAHIGYRTWDGKSKFQMDFNPAGAASVALAAPQQWCIVKKHVDAAKVAGSVAWACSKGGINCNSYDIKACGSGRSQAHAVYNAIFQSAGQNKAACDFGGTGKITNRNPFNPKRPRCVLPGQPS